MLPNEGLRTTQCDLLQPLVAACEQGPFAEFCSRSTDRFVRSLNRFEAIRSAGNAAAQYGRGGRDQHQAAVEIVTDVEHRSATLHVPVDATAT
jgi:hypothetical protein